MKLLRHHRPRPITNGIRMSRQQMPESTDPHFLIATTYMFIQKIKADLGILGSKGVRLIRFAGSQLILPNFLFAQQTVPIPVCDRVWMVRHQVPEPADVSALHAMASTDQPRLARPTCPGSCTRSTDSLRGSRADCSRRAEAPNRCDATHGEPREGRGTPRGAGWRGFCWAAETWSTARLANLAGTADPWALLMVIGTLGALMPFGTSGASGTFGTFGTLNS